MSFFKKVVLSLYLLFCFKLVESQTIASGIPYQTIVRNSSGNPILNQAVNIRFGIYSGSVSGPLVWEETTLSTTDTNGFIKLVIGKGVTTGNGLVSSFSLINWGSSAYYLKVGIDISAGIVFKDMGAARLISVPYAFYVANSDRFTDYYLNDLADVVAISPAVGKILKWNGSFWIAADDNYSDSVTYSITTSHARTSDTALYGYSAVSLIDSVLFAYTSDSANYAQIANYAQSVFTSTYSDTATYALSSAPNVWKTDGNILGNQTSFIATKDLQDVIFKTNNTEALRINTVGNFLVGASTPNTFNFSSSGNEGLLAINTFGTGAVATSGAGTKMYWYSAKAAFRAGAVTANQWDDSNVGAYSFAAGYNCIASGLYSVASGNSCVASGEATVAMGRKSQATAWGAAPSLGVSVALGDSSYATTPRSVAIGRGNLSALQNASFTIGSYNLANGAVSTALGFHSTASGHYSFVFGYYGSSNAKTGSFVYADASSSDVTNATANNQFLVRASGGVVFYSDSARTMGVTIPAGGGSWASISDKYKKENFQSMSAEDVLSKIEELDIKIWNYKSQSSSIKHIGPMAQDFYKTFGLGTDNKTISTVDMDGITLLGIKALNKRAQLLEPLFEIQQLSSQIQKLDNFNELNFRLDEIEKQLANKKNN